MSREDVLATAGRPIVLVTDAWHPQVNGVVHTWAYVQRELAALGHELQVIHPAGSRGVRAPGEPDLLLSTEPSRHLRRLLGQRAPAALHIATEGPLGWAARAMARAAAWPFTTSYHTRFPEYLKARFGLPAAWTYSMLRRFHRESRAILVPTEAMRGELQRAGFAKPRVWGRGVLHEDLRRACLEALQLARAQVRAAAVDRSWKAIAQDLLAVLVPIEPVST